MPSPFRSLVFDSGLTQGLVGGIVFGKVCRDGSAMCWGLGRSLEHVRSDILLSYGARRTVAPDGRVTTTQWKGDLGMEAKCPVCAVSNLSSIQNPPMRQYFECPGCGA